MSRNPHLHTTLCTLDAADANADSDSQRAQADLHRILATPIGAVRPPRRRSRALVHRTVLAGGVLAAVAAGVLALPAITGGDAAFASWTPRPHAMTPQASTEAASQCRSAHEGGAGAEYRSSLENAETAISERRGVWTTVVLTGDDGFSALCVTDTSRRLFCDMFGSVGTPSNYTAPTPRELITTDLGTGTIDAEDLSLAAGSAGADIVGVSFRSRTHGVVVATVALGRFALWLPGDELQDAASTGVEVQVTYRDGTSGTTALDL